MANPYKTLCPCTDGTHKLILVDHRPFFPLLELILYLSIDPPRGWSFFIIILGCFSDGPLKWAALGAAREDGAARLDRRQRGGEGCGKKGGKRKKISGGKNIVVGRATDYEKEGVTRGARGENR